VLFRVLLVLFYLIPDLANAQVAPAKEAQPTQEHEVQPTQETTVERVSLSGVLLEKGTRRPLAGVNVFILPHRLRGTTDERGRFEIKEVPKGAFQWIVNLTDYNRLERNDEAIENRNDVRLFLERNTYMGFETVVVGRVDKRDETVRSLRAEEFLTVPGAGRDPIKAVQNLPGVNRAAGNQADVIIQGSDPDDTRYTIDGHEIPLIFHFGGLTSVVTPEAVESVDFFSAGYGPEFGKAMGGFVGLNLRSPRTDRTHGIAFVDLLNAGGLIEGPIQEKHSYLISGRYSYIGPVLGAVLEGNDDFNLVVAPTFADLTSMYEWQISKNQSLRVLGLASEDRLEFILSEPVNEDPALRGRFSNRTGFYRLIPQWRKKWSEQTETSFSIGAGQNWIRFDLSDNYFNLRTRNLTTRGEINHRIYSWWRTFAGFDHEYSWYDIDLRLPDVYQSGGVSNPVASGEVRQVSLSGKFINLGFYLRNQVKPSAESPWTFSPNLRVDAFRRNSELVAQPRAGTTYQWNDSLSLRAAGGVYHQPPEPQEINETFGNPQLKSNRAYHSAIGFTKDFREGRSNGWWWSQGAFYKTLDRLVVPSAEFVERDGEQTPENFANRGMGRIFGSETQLKYSGDRYSLGLSYTLSQSRRKSPGQKEYPSEFDQTHSFNLISSVRLGVYTIGTRARFVTGNPYTPIVDSVFDSDNDVYIPIRGEFFSKRRPDFFQLDVRVDRKWIYETWILSAYLDIQNITNRKNFEGTSYSYDYRSSENITGIPILPTFGLQGEF